MQLHDAADSASLGRIKNRMIPFPDLAKSYAESGVRRSGRSRTGAIPAYETQQELPIDMLCHDWFRPSAADSHASPPPTARVNCSDSDKGTLIRSRR